MFAKAKIIKLSLILIAIAFLITGCGFFGDDADDLTLEYASIEADGEYYSGLNEIYLEFNNQVDSADLALSSSEEEDFDKDISDERVSISDFELDGDEDYEFSYSVSDEFGSDLQGEIEFSTFSSDLPDIDEAEMNETMYQAFYWNAYEGLWSDIAEEEYEYVDAEHLADVGITSMWLPPAAKAFTGQDDVGYGVYDLWDLGEFDQKGTEETRYGSRAELESALAELDNLGIEAYYDVVFNHRMGGDDSEEVPVAEASDYVIETDSGWKFTFDPEDWDDAPNADEIESVRLVGEMQDDEWDEEDYSYNLSEYNGEWRGTFSDIEAGQNFKFMYNEPDWDNEVPDGYGNDLVVQGDTIEAWTDFSAGLEGRDEHYNNSDDNDWDWQAFNGVDGTLFEGKDYGRVYQGDWYLMGEDVDYNNNDFVADEMKEWGEWIIDDVGFAGFRLDAIKHVDSDFTSSWLNSVQEKTEEDLFFVAEAWIGDRDSLIEYLEHVAEEEDENDEDLNPYLTAFDFPLREAFVDLNNGNLNDMGQLKEEGLVNHEDHAEKAVTFVDNHDTSRLEEDEYDEERISDFNHQAYAYILMHQDGLPTVYAKDYDYYNMNSSLEQLIAARKYFAYGESDESYSSQEVYVNVREGLAEDDGTGLVMLLSGRDDGGMQRKEVDSQQPDTEFYDYTGNVEGTITTDSDGYAEFKVDLTEASGWSVWVPKK